MIPRTVHQIWLGGGDGLPVPPPHLAEASRSWSARNPGWAHRVWTGAEIEALFAAARPDLLPLYKSYPWWVQRSDAARYLILHEHGGAYADFDVACAGSLGPLEYEGLVLAPTKPVGFSNDFMMASAGHPLLRALLDGLPEANRRWNRPWMPQYVRVMRGTASLYLTAVFRGLEDPGPVRRLTPDEYGQGAPEAALVRHLSGNSWHRWDTATLVFAWGHRRALAAALAVMAVGMAWLLS